jgi:DNA-binding beta-propeller fold protein YncE
VCAVAEGARVCADENTASAAAFAAALRDAPCRLCGLGGREGMPRSLGSVYACAVTLFLGSAFRGVERRCLHRGAYGGVAVRRDGTVLLTSYMNRVDHVRVSDGRLLGSVGGHGRGALQFRVPCQIAVAPDDDYVFIAEFGNNRVQVLTPELTFCGFLGVNVLLTPMGVCVGDGVVAVSQRRHHRVSVFRRADWALVRHIGRFGSGKGALCQPAGLAFLAAGQQRQLLAVADAGNHRVSVCTAAGRFVRHIGAGRFTRPQSVACSAHNELVVSDDYGVSVWSVDGDMLKAFGRGACAALAVASACVFACEWPQFTVTVYA